VRLLCAGCTGLIGGRLLPELVAAGHQPVVLSRDPERAQRDAPPGLDLEWRRWDGEHLDADIGPVDAVINLCGAGIADQRWSSQRKRVLRDSRSVPSAALATFVAEHGIPLLVQASAIGWYGERAQAVDESAPAGEGFLADLTAAWEASAAPAEDAAQFEDSEDCHYERNQGDYVDIAVHFPVLSNWVRREVAKGVGNGTSAAIPFFFPAVRIGDRYYVDGGLRMNTPLSPVLRLRSDRVLVVSLRRARDAALRDAAPYAEEIVTQPAFMLGKVLDALTLDQLEYELQRIDLVNAMIDRGEEAFGPEYLERMNPVVRAQRGAGYRHVASRVLRPSEDLGRLAAECYGRAGNARAMGVLPSLLTRLAKQGVPDDEADLLSYLYFDGCYTSQLVELGREDTKARHDEVVELLGAADVD